MESEEAAYLTWDGQRERMSNSTRGEVGRVAGLWAINRLEHYLGHDWPQRTAAEEGRAPSFLILAPYYAHAFAELIEFALRLHLLANVGGMGKVRRDLKHDLTADRRMHTGLILALAGLGMRQGWDVAVEARVEPTRPPTDVVFTTPSGIIAVETFVVHMADTMNDGIAYSDTISRVIERIGSTHKVWVNGSLNEVLDAAETATWIEDVEEVAKRSAVDGREYLLDHPAGRVLVGPLLSRPAAGHKFTGPLIHGGDPRRLGEKLRAKAEQAVGVGGEWIRADILDGLWQFTPWSTWGLRDKGEAIADLVRDVVSGIDGLLGAVLTSGAAATQSASADSTARLTRGGFALRRPLPLLRERETIIVPIHQGMNPQVEAWVQIYDAEPTWDDCALSQVGLAPVTKLFGL